MTIKEVAKQTGLTEKTIRYYEEQGFIHPDVQEKNGRHFRSYGEKDVTELENVALLRRMRFTIGEIRMMKETDADVPEILEGYLKRIEDEMEQLVEIHDMVSRMKIGELCSLKELESRAAQCLPKPVLPFEDMDFATMDRQEHQRKCKSLRSIRIWPRKKLFPVRLNMMETRILFYLMEGERTFTEICYYCMNNGMARDVKIVGKAVKKMKRKKVLSQNGQVCCALVDEQSIAAVDVERMVQIASTGTGDLLLVYSWVPPMSVNSIPYTGL